MRLLIAGSRKGFSLLEPDSPLKLKLWRIFDFCVAEFDDDPTSLVCGMAAGVDEIGRDWAHEQNLPVEAFPVLGSDWKRLGKKAGPMRNNKMAETADAAIIIWDGKSRGARDMLGKVIGLVPTTLFIIKPPKIPYTPIEPKLPRFHTVRVSRGLTR